jgi:hypothetical protein
VGEQSLAAAASSVPQKEFIYTSYKLPCYYGQNLDLKLKNGLPFNFLDYSSLGRELGKSIYNKILLQAILKSFVLLFAKLYLNFPTCWEKRKRAKLISK